MKAKISQIFGKKWATRYRRLLEHQTGKTKKETFQAQCNIPVTCEV
jgi:hypothetical protein